MVRYDNYLTDLHSVNEKKEKVSDNKAFVLNKEVKSICKKLQKTHNAIFNSLSNAPTENAEAILKKINAIEINKSRLNEIEKAKEATLKEISKTICDFKKCINRESENISNLIAIRNEIIKLRNRLKEQNNAQMELNANKQIIPLINALKQIDIETLAYEIDEIYEFINNSNIIINKNFKSLKNDIDNDVELATLLIDEIKENENIILNSVGKIEAIRNKFQLIQETKPVDYLSSRSDIF